MVVLVAFALGNGCGGDGQYPYQEQQGGAEYVIGTTAGDGEGIFSCWIPKEKEEEVHERNKEICKKLGGGLLYARVGSDYVPKASFIENRDSFATNGMGCVQDFCDLPRLPPTGKNIFLENLIYESLAYVGLDWKEHPYRVVDIIEKDVYVDYQISIKVVMKNMVLVVGGVGDIKSCLESYPEYSQVIFQNGECNGQNSMRDYVPNNDKNIISKTDIDDVHKKNKEICNKISGHNYTKGETEIIGDNDVTFTDECKVDIYKEIWTENVIAELFNRKGLTEIPYKINFIWADKPSGSYKSTVVGIKIPNMDIFVTLHKTKSCLLSCSKCNVFQIEPNPQVQGHGECIQTIWEREENTSVYFKKDKQRKLANMAQSVLWIKQR